MVFESRALERVDCSSEGLGTKSRRKGVEESGCVLLCVSSVRRRSVNVGSANTERDGKRGEEGGRSDREGVVSALAGVFVRSGGWRRRSR